MSIDELLSQLRTSPHLPRRRLLSIDSHDLFGLGSGIAHYRDLVKMTDSERNEAAPALPHALLPLQNDGFGDHFCVDTRSRAGPIVFFSHELPSDQELEVVAPTLEAWLLELFEEHED